MQLDSESENDGDPRYHIPKGIPLITPERAAKGDVFTGPDCNDCSTTGKDKITKLPCKTCKGRGWVGSINAATVDNAHIRFAQVQVRNILNYLWEQEIITDDQNTDGHLFAAWRDQHRLAMGLQSPIMVDILEPHSIKLRAYGFVLLIRRLSHYDVKAISKAIDVLANSSTQQDALRESRQYHIAFTNLARVIIPIKQQVAYLEGLSDEDRRQLSDDKLKKLLAELNQ